MGKLNYQSPLPLPLPPPPGRNVLRFFIGLIAGTAVSAVVWLIGFQTPDSAFGSGAVLILPTIKIVGGIACLCFPGWRSLGAGILVSLALGFLIFFGMCATHLGNMH